LVVQGFTLAPLVRRTGLAVPDAESHDEYLRARVRLAEVGAAHVEQLAELEAVPPVVLDRVRRSLGTRLEMARERAAKAGLAVERPAETDMYRRMRRELVEVQSTELESLYASGEINDATRRRIQHQLDLEDARFTDDH
jgi:CPA1 family monovalent cation:H+ antiporter